VKYLLDTNVYLNALRSELKKAQFRQTFFPLLPSTFLSAVVTYELYVNAQDNRTRGLVQEFVRPMERTGRVISPAFDDWVEASRVVTAIAEKNRDWRSKLPALLNDVLIALCARRIGATLLTYNQKDFRLIRRHKDFSLRVLVSST
jgi:predicted nucleic acid-binding protein